MTVIFSDPSEVALHCIILFWLHGFAGDCGRSNKPARVLLIGTHPDTINCKKNVLGEWADPPTWSGSNLMAAILAEFGNVFR